MHRNRWARRIAIGLILGFVLSIVAFFYGRYSTRRDGNERLVSVVAHLDETDPRWRLDDIEADRKSLNDDQNSALLVPRFKAALAQKEFMLVRSALTREGVFVGIPPNLVLDDEGVAAIDAAMQGYDAALAIARSFKDYPYGRTRFTITPDVIGILLPHLQWTQQVCCLLDAEAERLCRDGRPGAAVELVRAMLNAARSIDGEAFLISSQIRYWCDSTAVGRVERIFGLTSPKGGLAEVQAMLLAEADADCFWPAVRFERGALNLLFTNLQNGVLPPGFASVVSRSGAALTRPDSKDYVSEWVYSPHMPGDQATYLETVTRTLEVRKLPDHQQRAALKAVALPPKEPGSMYASLLTPRIYELHDTSLRTRAALRCAAAAVAAERFRLRNGRWPNALDEIPRDILVAVPIDPFDGQPLKYVRRPDGVTIYSVGLNEQDDGGNVTKVPPTEVGVDIGFRLYDPAERGLAPIPRPALASERPNLDLEPDLDRAIEFGPAPREVKDR